MTTIVSKELEAEVMEMAVKGKGYEALAAGIFLVLEDIADSLRRIADRLDKR